MAVPMTYLEMTFATTDGDRDTKIRLNYADDEADSSDVNALMGTIITNKAMFDTQPLEKVAAQIVTTSVRDIIIS